jgi:hypothetical protein
MLRIALQQNKCISESKFLNRPHELHCDLREHHTWLGRRQRLTTDVFIADWSGCEGGVGDWGRTARLCADLGREWLGNGVRWLVNTRDTRSNGSHRPTPMDGNDSIFTMNLCCGFSDEVHQLDSSSAGRNFQLMIRFFSMRLWELRRARLCLAIRLFSPGRGGNNRIQQYIHIICRL